MIFDFHVCLRSKTNMKNKKHVSLNEISEYEDDKFAKSGRLKWQTDAPFICKCPKIILKSAILDTIRNFLHKIHHQNKVQQFLSESYKGFYSSIFQYFFCHFFIKIISFIFGSGDCIYKFAKGIIRMFENGK